MKDKNYTILFEKYLRNEASADEVAQLQATMHHDAKIQAIFEDELRYSDSSMDENTRHKLFQNIRRQVYKEKEPRFLQKSWKKALYWAAIFILPVISAFSVYYYFTQKQQIVNHPTEIIARYGEKAEVVLPDGSKVWINSGSKIIYDDAFNRKQRPVFLEGEACFEVATDKNRPFVVKTKTMNIQVNVSGPGNTSKSTIHVKIVDLNKNPPPNPVADDRNDGFTRASVPTRAEKERADWSIWRPWWQEYWVDEGHWERDSWNRD